MSLAIVGKLLGGLVVSSSGIAAITYMVINSNTYVELDKKDSKNNIYIYAIIKGVASNVAAADESSTEKITEYKCKFNQKDYQCIISKVTDLDSATKQAYVEDPDIDLQTKTDIVESELTAAGTIYKILIKSDIKDWTKDKDKFGIEIIKDKTTTYAPLKPLFAIKSGGSSDDYTKTEYFVVKKNEVSQAEDTSVGITVGATKTTFSHKCETSNTASDETTAAAANNCNVYDFSSEASSNNKTLHELVFTKTDTPTNDTSFSTANKHYLVKLNEPVTVNKVKHINITASGSTVSFQNKEIIPAIQITEKTDSIFILQTKKSVQENSKTK